MISAGDFRNGLTVEIDNSVFQIIEFQHVKPGKGAAFVRTKLRDIKNGGVKETTFRPTEKFPQARIDRKNMQYMYADGDMYNFMDNETYEQFALTSEQVGDALKFVKENETVSMLSHDTATGATKPAVVETGATVYVPLFVNQGDKIQIDTRTGEYLKRV